MAPTTRGGISKVRLGTTKACPMRSPCRAGNPTARNQTWQSVRVGGTRHHTQPPKFDIKPRTEPRVGSGADARLATYTGSR